MSLVLAMTISMVGFEGLATDSYARVTISDSAPDATGVEYVFDFQFQDPFDGDAFEGEVVFTFEEDFNSNGGAITDSGGCAEDTANEVYTCTGLSATDTVTFTVTNPGKTTTEGEADTYVVELQADTGEWGNAMFAIIEPVVVTARVSALLSFTVEGVGEEADDLHGERNIDITTTATSIEFGTLDTETPLAAAQDLTVSTNASEGYSVTVFQDQDLTSPGGDTIKSFLDGTPVATSAAATWAGPGGQLADPDTWGHFGFTTEDVQVDENCLELDGADGYFGSNVWAGFDGDTPEEIMCHVGPSDGETLHAGTTRVGYQIEISDLQPAGEYTNTLTYIATPTF